MNANSILLIAIGLLAVGPFLLLGAIALLTGGNKPLPTSSREVEYEEYVWKTIR